MPLAYCGRCAYCRRGLQHLCATMACVGLSHALGRHGGARHRRRVPGRAAPRGGDAMSKARSSSRRRSLPTASNAPASAPATACWSRAPAPSARSPRLCARAAGASEVYVSEPNPARRARAEALGVATVLDPTSVDVPELSPRATATASASMSRSSARAIRTGFATGDSLAAPARHARADGLVRRRGVGRADALGAERPHRSSAPGATGSTTSTGSRRRSPPATCRSSASSRARRRSTMRRTPSRGSPRARPTRSRC